MQIAPTNIVSALPMPPVSSQLVTGAKDISMKESKELAADFLGSTFFKMLMKSMRKSVPESAYFGSYANSVFQDFLDDELSTFMGEAESPLLNSIAEYIYSAKEGSLDIEA